MPNVDLPLDTRVHLKQLAAPTQTPNTHLPIENTQTINALTLYSFTHIHRSVLPEAGLFSEQVGEDVHLVVVGGAGHDAHRPPVKMERTEEGGPLEQPWGRGWTMDEGRAGGWELAIGGGGARVSNCFLKKDVPVPNGSCPLQKINPLQTNPVPPPAHPGWRCTACVPPGPPTGTPEGCGREWQPAPGSGQAGLDRPREVWGGTDNPGHRHPHPPFAKKAGPRVPGALAKWPETNPIPNRTSAGQTNTSSQMDSGGGVVLVMLVPNSIPAWKRRLNG